ncbi:MAG: hypothetical protein Ta2F_02800 [Termitinemataceae bacterium]|nr:MAG: hypothetical protein Ta2F_02800 [Termitinemataceae bacterium]
MRKSLQDRPVFWWRTIAVLSLLVWLMSFVIRVFYFGLNGHEQDFLITDGYYIIYAVVLFALFVLVIFPLNFRIYAFVYTSFGLLRLINGDSIVAIFMYLLGISFSYKIDFFKKRMMIKISLYAAAFIAAIVSQKRYGGEFFFNNLLLYIMLILIMALAFLLFLPEIKKIRCDFKTSELRLSTADFTERDAEILQRIQQGEKYEAIAAEYDIATITLKKLVRKLFYRLGVSDRTIFLSKYSGRKIVLQ